ncbi:MAG TPA: YdjY domain-containing protein [Tepidisphaeraceae bacterium]|nr:YdjY domain-containing protein [Tepidisphaeraceae bacterium]
MKTFVFATFCLCICTVCFAQTQPAGVVHFPHIVVDVPHKQLLLQCEALDCDAPLELLCCVAGTHDYESVLRTGARPSQVHLGLLMLGLKPGEPAHYSEAEHRWIPPTGDHLNVEAEFTKAGKKIRINACHLMRNIKTQKPMPQTPWVFAGSKIVNGTYTADVTGYLLTIVNFDWSVMDVPMLRSNSNATLQWERDPTVAPPGGTMVTLILTPAKR